jgi:hypothetical protein
MEKARANPAWQRLKEGERNTIAALDRELRERMRGGDHKQIREAVERLNQATMRLAELMMDSAVASALHGKGIEQAGAELGEGPEAPHPIAPAEIK